MLAHDPEQQQAMRTGLAWFHAHVERTYGRPFLALTEPQLSDEQFDDLELHIKFLCAPGANSGVYLRGRYEVQIEDDPNPEPANWRTGSIYGFIAPSPPAPRQPAQWHVFDLTLIGRRVTVVLDGRTIVANQEIPGITGGALDSHEALPGPIYLQGSEDGRVSFRNIVVRPVLH